MLIITMTYLFLKKIGKLNLHDLGQPRFFVPALDFSPMKSNVKEILKKIFQFQNLHLKRFFQIWSSHGLLERKNGTRTFKLVLAFCYDLEKIYSINYVLLFTVVIAPLAQWIARWTSNPEVLGSSPRWGKVFIHNRRGTSNNLTVAYLLILFVHKNA